MDKKERKAQVLKEFGQRIKKLREAKEKTLVEAGKDLGISKSAFSRIENGESSPDMDVLIELADYFNVSINFLFGYEDITDGLTKENKDNIIRIADALKGKGEDK